MRKIKLKMTKLVYLGLSILEISKTLTYELWYDCQYNAKVCYVDRDSFITYINTEDVYEDIANYVEKKFETANYAIERPLPKERNKNVIGLMKNELDEKIMTVFVGLKSKTYPYLIDDGSEDKKTKRTKKSVIKCRLNYIISIWCKC